MTRELDRPVPTDSATCDAADWLRIQNTLQRYADCVDRADLAGVLACFSPDAVWTYVDGRSVQGHDAIGSFFRERFTAFQQTSHHPAPPLVQCDAATGALQSTTYFFAEHALRDGSNYTAYGRCIDRWERLGGGLLISGRHFVAHDAVGTDRATQFIARLPATL